LVVTKAMIDRMTADGLRIRHYRASPGDVVPCTVAPDDDVVATYLEAPVEGVQRVDLVLSDATGALLSRTDDVPVDAATGEVVYVMAGNFVHTMPASANPLHVELWAHDADKPRRLARYTFQHTLYAPP
jgi:hypothetical protein